MFRYQLLAVACMFLLSSWDNLDAQTFTDAPATIANWGVNTWVVTGSPSSPVVQSVSPFLMLNSEIGVAAAFSKPICWECDQNFWYTAHDASGFLFQQSFAFHVDAPGAYQISGLYPGSAPTGMDQCVQTLVPYAFGGPEYEAGFFADEMVSENGVPIIGGALSAYYYYSTPGMKTVTYTAYTCSPDGVETQVVAAKLAVTFAIGPALVDPVPSLISGSSVTSNSQSLATGGQLVQGVAADGVTEAVVRVPLQGPDQITLTLLNDQGTPSTSTDEDGALGNPGDTQFSQGQVTVTGESANSSYYAFAVYRAPIDFARLVGGTPGNFKSGTCNNVNNTDGNLACRTVSIQIQDATTGTTQTIVVTIVRPPVAMVHGLWDNWETWNNFSPLVLGKSSVDPRFSILRANYDIPVSGTVIAESPVAPNIWDVHANSLGISYTSPIVLEQIQKWLQSFKQGNNPIGAPVAAVQTDIVAHSMGGLIARKIALSQTFLNPQNFGQGSIHKLITIDTPHLGSPVALQLLPNSSQQEDTCLLDILAWNRKFVFENVLISSQGVVNGAIHDLKGDGIGGSLSDALTAISAQGSHPLPTALISGVYTNFASLDGALFDLFVRKQCTADPVAQDLTSTGWPTIFSNSSDPNSGNNDAIVSETSQLNGFSTGTGSDQVFTGVVHSKGTESLGFSPPSVLDPDPTNEIPMWVIQELNTPVNTPGSFVAVNP